MTVTAVTAVTDVTAVDHTWSLRDDEFEDGEHVRRFECVSCGAVRFE